MSTQQAPGFGAYTWTFGDRLRKIRRVNGLSQKEFAAEIGADPKSLSAWESDAWLPRGIMAIARRIAIRYRVPIAWVLGVDDGGPTGGPGYEELPHLDSNQEPAD